MNKVLELFPDETRTGTNGPLPILMERGDIIYMKQAEDRAGRDFKTIKIWIEKHGIGRHSCWAAPYEISAPALEMVMSGDLIALELLREGNRSHPRVKRYFDHLGIMV